jgi:phage shock protein C
LLAIGRLFWRQLALDQFATTELEALSGHFKETIMLLSVELTKLQELHQCGVLTDEEFSHAKSRLLDSSVNFGVSAPSEVLTSINALRRSRNNRWIAGICSGIAIATGMESWLVRLVFALLLLFGGAGALIYMLLWLFVPIE